jgi:thiamine pyrophosphate-dependent acetolactate synthase large subunit-like protein/nitrite reductase/ring-hydroxylating ferredoxin subunit
MSEAPRDPPNPRPSTPRRLRWYRAADAAELPEGRVKTVACGSRSVCLTRFQGQFGALDNRCPHQGGPLGEGSIEGGWLRCPWHGWDYHPLTGAAPGGFDERVPVYPVELRDDGVYVGVEEAEEPAAKTVSDVLVETMRAWGVRWTFGMVGHSNLGVAEALRLAEERGDLTFVGVRHEGAAAFAISAYGKLTGRPAAALTIAGPGATNLLTGLWDAHVDRAPAIALTGQVDTQVLGPGAFQEIDLKAAFGGVAVWSQTVLSSSRHAELMNLACKHAILGRGVAHLIVPDEVANQPAPAGARAGGPEGRLAARTIAPPDDALAAALALLERARRPVIIVGHGARFHMDEVVALAERLRCPVLTTFKAKGQVSDLHPLGAGVLGRSGTPVASWFMNEADLLLVLGASFSNHTGITPKKPTIQVDFDALALGKFHPVTVPVWGEIGVTAALLRERLGAVAAVDQTPEVAARWALWRAEKRSRASDDRGRGIASASLFAALSGSVAEDAIIAVDVGNNAYSFGRYFECRRQTVLMSGYLGSIGFALPAAMGAWAATREDDPRFAGRRVVSISGDGGFAQYMGEWLTAVKYGMNITHVLLNNGELGKISKEQRAGRWHVWQTSLHNPDFAAYARACGSLGLRVAAAGELDAALGEALAHAGPALVEVMTDVELV